MRSWKWHHKIREENKNNDCRLGWNQENLRYWRQQWRKENWNPGVKALRSLNYSGEQEINLLDTSYVEKLSVQYSEVRKHGF